MCLHCEMAKPSFLLYALSDIATTLFNLGVVADACNSSPWQTEIKCYQKNKARSGYIANTVSNKRKRRRRKEDEGGEGEEAREDEEEEKEEERKEEKEKGKKHYFCKNTKSIFSNFHIYNTFNLS